MTDQVLLLREVPGKPEPIKISLSIQTAKRGPTTFRWRPATRSIWSRRGHGHRRRLAKAGQLRSLGGPRGPVRTGITAERGLIAHGRAFPEHAENELEIESSASIAHTLLRFLFAVRYRKNVMLAAMAVSILLGCLYYSTATRYYRANAAPADRRRPARTLNASITGEERRAAEFNADLENMIRKPRCSNKPCKLSNRAIWPNSVPPTRSSRSITSRLCWMPRRFVRPTSSKSITSCATAASR